MEEIRINREMRFKSQVLVLIGMQLHDLTYLELIDFLNAISLELETRGLVGMIE